MVAAVEVESLNEILRCKESYDFILGYVKGGVAVWDANFECVYFSSQLRRVFHICDQSLVPDLGVRDIHDSRPVLRTYLTDRGFCYVETTLQKITNPNKVILGYLSICQDVTALQEPKRFKDLLMHLLKCVARGANLEEACRTIYRCVELLGFREVSIATFHPQTDSLRMLAKVGKNGVFENKIDTEVPEALVQSAMKWNQTKKFEPIIFNEENAFVCLPVMADGVLLGSLILSKSLAQNLTLDLLDNSGRTSDFLFELATVFKNILHERPEKEIETKRLLMRSKLERMNLNQRQIEITEMLARGETNKGIANAIHLSEQGVKYHVGNLLERFQSRNRLELRTKLHELVSSNQ